MVAVGREVSHPSPRRLSLNNFNTLGLELRIFVSSIVIICACGLKRWMAVSPTSEEWP